MGGLKVRLGACLQSLGLRTERLPKAAAMPPLPHDVSAPPAPTPPGRPFSTPATGFPLLMVMPKWALTSHASADAAAATAVTGGKNVFLQALSRGVSKLGDIYFGKGQLPKVRLIPQILISGFNLTASFALANVVRRTLEASSNTLHDYLPFLYNKVDHPSNFFDGGEFEKTWNGGLLSLVIFLGVGLVVPRIALGSSPLKSIPVGQAVPWLDKLKYYSLEFGARGLLGVVRLMGDRDGKEVQFLDAAKAALQSYPVSTWIQDHVSSKGAAAVASAMTYALIDWPMAFAGRVLPNRKAKFAGVGVDIGVNTSLSAWNIYAMSHALSFTDIGSSLLITTMMAFANVHLTQHQGFNANQMLGHRTVLGIGKAGANTGFASTNVASTFSKYAAQFIYGLFAMWYANKISELNPPIGPIEEVRPSADTLATIDAVTKRLAMAQISGKPVTIVVIDSGLGGMTVVNDLTGQLQQGPFEEVNIVYYNAVPRWDRGFNRLDDVHRSAVLDRILGRIDADYSPDLVVMTDHTLTSIYPHTAHALNAPQTLVDVVSPGVDYITAGLKQYPNAKVVFMGGPVTIKSGLYQRQMEARGIPSSRVLVENCPTLSAAVEGNLNDNRTEALIHAHAAAIRDRVRDLTTPVFVSLNSSQFAFIADRLQAALREQGLLYVQVIDPTARITRGLFSRLPGLAQGVTPQVSLSVVSQVSLDPVMSGGLGTLLDARMPRIGAAVHGYRQIDLPFALPEEPVKLDKN